MMNQKFANRVCTLLRTPLHFCGQLQTFELTGSVILKTIQNLN